MSCDKIMTEVDIIADPWKGKCSTHLQSFPAGIVQKVITFFNQVSNSHLIDIFMIAVGSDKKLIYGG